MNHTECRRTIVLDEVDAAATAHLKGCAACRAFAGEVERLDEIAPSLAATPPAGLEDRVLTRLREETAFDGATVTPLQRPWRDSFRSAMRTTGVRLTSAAAVLILVVALVSVVRTAGPSQVPSDIVLASAQATTDTGSAEVAVSATTEVVLDAPGQAEPGRRPEDPRFAHAPPEMRPYLRHEWQQAMAEFERQMAQFLVDVDAAIEQGTRDIDEGLREMERAFSESFGAPARPRRPARPNVRPPAPPTPPRAPGMQPEADEPPPPQPPSSVRAEVAVRARGSVDFADDVLSLQGAVRAGGDGAATGRPFRVAADADATAYQSATGEWTRLPGPAGPMGTVLLDPQAVLRIAGAAEGEGEVVGEADIRGETVQRYRLELDERKLGAASRVQGEWTAEAYVGSDGRLRRMHLVSQPVADASAGMRWQSRVEVDLSGYGRAPAPGAVPQTSREAQLPGRSSLLLYPLGPSVAEALDAQAARRP